MGAGGIEDGPDPAGDMGPCDDPRGVLFGRGLLKAIEIAEQVAPFDVDLLFGIEWASSILRTSARHEQKTRPRIAAS